MELKAVNNKSINRIQLEDIGKRYGKHWLFRHFNAEFQLNDRIGIKGINGSGKSTLLQLIAGICLPSEGQLTYTDEEGRNIDLNDLAGHLSLLSPYMDVPEQLNLKELFDFQEKIWIISLTSSKLQYFLLNIKKVCSFISLKL